MNIEGFMFSDGWLRNFKKRYDLAFKRMCGESGAVDRTLVANYRSETLESLLSQFSPDDVFNCDETALFYKMLPDKTLSVSGDPCHGGKHSKERVTIMVGSNMSGTEKLPLLVIGKSKRPRCFKGAKSLPVLYEANKKAWITQQLFSDYVRKLDRKFKSQNRKVLLFVDNCGAHGHIHDLECIRLEFLPPNTTSVLQPMDQGIIKNLKVLYRARLLNRMVVCIDAGKQYCVSLLSAINMLADAWKAVAPATLQNCFRHAGFVITDEVSAMEAPDLSPSDVLPTEAENVLQDLRSGGIAIPDTVSFDSFTNADSAVLTCAELDDDEIIRQVCAPPDDDSESEDDAPCAPPPSHAELVQAVTVLSAAYSDRTTLSEIEADLIARKRNSVQRRIHDFFAPAAAPK
ncbi:tigger transposable element-derived protein 4-like [Dermacentor albipictus]|uniref:tigger transposable element-derived protein 4-like n=1 Tax=Dermacentor albipictus TaxID=60249 RepID=UPI0038FD3976